MATLRLNLQDLYMERLPFLDKVLFERMPIEDQISESILKVRDIGNKPFVNTTTVGSFSTVPIKPEGVNVTYQDLAQGFDKKYTPDTYELGFRATMEALDDEQEEVISDAARALGSSAMYTIEADCANIFNSMTSTTGSPDGVALFSTAHPLVGGPATGKNRPTTDADLSTSSLRSALNDIADTVDDGGKLVHWRPKILLVPYELKWTADELLNSVDRSDTPDRAKNAFRGDGLRVVSWPYLTDPDAWFLLGEGDDIEVRKYWRQRPTTMHDWDFESSSAKMKIRFRFVRGWSDWRGTYGTTGA